MLRLQTICVSIAVNTAMCGDKDGKFQEFLNALVGEKEDINARLDDAKNKNLPIEDN